jgi:uncharacterized protein YndB with AHSA1/START domain
MNDGILEQAGERWRLRFSRVLPHPPERVWRALTAPEELAAWFPDRLEGDLTTVGARLRFSHDGGAFDPFDGEVLAAAPPRLLEFRWGPDIIRIEIVPAPGGSALTFTDTFAELGKAARDGAGWHLCLEHLEHALDGTTAPGPPRERWSEIHPGYVERFGAAASALGVPDGM